MFAKRVRINKALPASGKYISVKTLKSPLFRLQLLFNKEKAVYKQGENPVSFHKISTRSLTLSLFLLLALTFTSFGQGDSPIVNFDGLDGKEMPIAVKNNLYCAGYIQKSNVSTSLKIVGADDEKDQHIYSQGDDLYINSGAENGVKVGDMYAVVRPRGKIKSKWTKKKGLGIYIQEVGAVEVVKVMRNVSVARVKTSCSTILLGDLLQNVPSRKSPLFKKRNALDTYSLPSGKAQGRIVMARDGIEMVSREHIVYIDLGREDNVSIGDYLTIFRPLGTGNIFGDTKDENLDNREAGFQSDRYKGGMFSNQAARKKGSKANGKVVTTDGAKKGRPALRKIVGEMVILNVLERTATAVIVRNASEIHTGDYVEVQ